LKTLNKNINLEELENLLEKNSREITIPVTGIKSDFFLVPSIIQVLATLDRRSKFLYKINFATEEQYENHVFSELGFPLISYFWKQGIYNKDNENIKYDLREYTKRYYEELNTKYYASKGNSVTIASYDHFPKAKGLDKLFYDRNGELIQNHFLIANNCQIVFERVLRMNQNYLKVIAPLFDDLTTILWELFKNTHDHAKTDINGSPLIRNIRGIHCKFYRIKKSEVGSKHFLNKNLKKYLEDPIHIENGNFSSFLEISVFDAGPGFIQRNSNDLNEEISTDKQVDIIRKCLTKNQGSVKGAQGELKGFGLDYVLRCLGNKGYLRIRTEQVCVTRNMIQNPYNTMDADKNIVLHDWQTNSTKKFTKHEKISGSLVSIIYPLKKL